MIDGPPDEQGRARLVEEIDAILQKVGISLLDVAQIASRSGGHDLLGQEGANRILLIAGGQGVRVGRQPTQVAIQIYIQGAADAVDEGRSTMAQIGGTKEDEFVEVAGDSAG